MFQSIFGRKTRNATRPPSQIHLLRKTRRCSVRRSPITIPETKKAIEYFSSSPRPAKIPTHSQYFGLFRLIARITKYAEAIHKFGSRQLVVNKLPFERYCGATRMATALNSKA